MILFAFGFPTSLLNEVHSNNIGYFQVEQDVFKLKLDLSESDSELYVVAEFDGETRNDSIESLTVQLRNYSGEQEEFELPIKRSSSNEALKFGWYGKKIILGYFQITSNDKYQLLIKQINRKGKIDNLVLSLHKNSNWMYEGTLVILSVILFLLGVLLIFIDMIKFGYYKLFKTM